MTRNHIQRDGAASLRSLWRLLVLATALACASTTAAEADGDRSRELLARYQGTWEGEIQTFDTPWSKAGTQRWVIDNWCTPAREFYACRQQFNGGQPTLTIYTLAGSGGTHSSVMLDLQGQVIQSRSLTAHGDTLIFPWETVDSDGTRHYFRIINTWLDLDCIQFRKEFSSDGAAWHAMASGLERRSGTSAATGHCS